MGNEWEYSDNQHAIWDIQKRMERVESKIDEMLSMLTPNYIPDEEPSYSSMKVFSDVGGKWTVDCDGCQIGYVTIIDRICTIYTGKAKLYQRPAPMGQTEDVTAQQAIDGLIEYHVAEQKRMAKEKEANEHPTEDKPRGHWYAHNRK